MENRSGANNAFHWCLRAVTSATKHAKEIGLLLEWGAGKEAWSAQGKAKGAVFKNLAQCLPRSCCRRECVRSAVATKSAWAFSPPATDGRHTPHGARLPSRQPLDEVSPIWYANIYFNNFSWHWLWAEFDTWIIDDQLLSIIAAKLFFMNYS